MTLNVYILMIIRSYTNYNNRDIYKIMWKDIDLYQIVCKYIGNNIMENVSINL